MSTRRVIRKIEPNRTEHFDAQFWPVVVALVVLSGITTGAILTLLKGPWMWASLLLLPALVAGTVWFLQRLNNRQLRRALQFAIVVSMTIHMLVLIFASMTDVFGKARTQNTQETVQRPQRVILTSPQDQPKIWEQVQRHEIAEPEVEVEKQARQSEPQPIPVKPQPARDSRVSRSAERSESVPRFDEALSQLHSSTDSRRRNNARNSPLTSDAVAPSNQPAETAKASESSPSEASVSSPTKSASESNAPAQKSLAKESSATEKKAVSRRKASQSEQAKLSEPSESTARIRRRSPSLPKTSAPSESAKTPSAAKTAKKTTAPVEVAQTVSRREQPSTVERRPQQSLPEVQRSQSQKTSQAAARRFEETPAPPSVSELTANPINPRRSQRAAELPSSMKATESPSPNQTADNSNNRRLQPTSASVTQQKSRAVGADVSPNVSNQTGGLPSTARTPSDTASRRRTTAASAPDSLTSLQSSKARRSVTDNRQVESAFKANTTMIAKIAGTRRPSKKTATAAAASIDSSSNAFRSEVSAHRGESQLDIGPKKVTQSTSTRRVSGGGHPEIDDLNLEAVAAKRQSRGSAEPTLDTDNRAQTAAKKLPNTRSASSTNISPNEMKVASDREQGSDAMAGEPVEVTRQGPTADSSEPAIAGLLAKNREKRATSEPLESTLDEENENEELRGRSKARLAQAPRLDTKRTYNVGDQSSEKSPAGELSATVLDVAMEGRADSDQSPVAGRTQLAAAPESSAVQDRGSVQRAESQSGRDSNLLSENDSPAAERLANRGNGPKLSSETDLAAGTPTRGESRAGTQQTATETEIEIERGQLAGSIELVVDASEGPAGLAMEPSTRLGIRARPATRESDDISSDVDTRFKRENSGAVPDMSPDASIAKKAFRGRAPNQGGGGPRTEAAIELGLEFFIRNQKQNGSWTLSGYDEDNDLNLRQLHSDTAATGLVLIAFQGAGYNHREFKYSLPLNHAIDWMIANQDENGCLYIEKDDRSNASCRMYSHAIATLALTEAYGMTQDVKLKKPIEKALQYIETTQDESRGGWRYYPDVIPNAPLRSRATDTSVTGWMLMALQSGRLSGFEVQPLVLKRIESWLDVAAELGNEGRFRYNPEATDEKNRNREAGRKASPSMTSVGLLMRLYLGWDRDDVRFQKGADYLLENLPADSTSRQRDTYYWYYATQVMRHVGGEKWEKWNEALHPLLVESQEQEGEMAGSWDPYLPIPDRWGDSGGRLYVTAMNLLSLEVDYRLLPLYEESSR